MSIICPSVTANDASTYRTQMARVAQFAGRVHLDFSDGILSPVKSVNPAQAYWPENVLADVHLMFQHPQEQIETAISLNPNMILIHSEADGDLLGMIRQFHAVGVKAGVVLLQKTEAESAHNLIADADHVLIFSGDLGHFGGVADLGLLRKVRDIRMINPNVEIGWDGGISLENIAQLALGGVEVFDVGGNIQNMPDPKDAYNNLMSKIPKERAGG